MNHEDFVKFVQEADFLDADRKNFLISNSPWMTDKERDLMLKEISKTGEVIDKNNQLILEELDNINETVLDFERVEMPKIRKEEEKTEAKESEEEAEKLLEKF